MPTNQHTSAPKWLLKRCTNAKQRCTNPNDPTYDRYGGRGIRFKFSSPADMAEYLMTLPNYSQDMQIDRIDNDGHYERDNLRWVTHASNQRNRRCSDVTTAEILSYLDKGWTQTDVAELFGLTQGAVSNRLRNYHK